MTCKPEEHVVTKAAMGTVVGSIDARCLHEGSKDKQHGSAWNGIGMSGVQRMYQRQEKRQVPADQRRRFLNGPVPSAPQTKSDGAATETYQCS